MNTISSAPKISSELQRQFDGIRAHGNRKYAKSFAMNLPSRILTLAMRRIYSWNSQHPRECYYGALVSRGLHALLTESDDQLPTANPEELFAAGLASRHRARVPIEVYRVLTILVEELGWSRGDIAVLLICKGLICELGDEVTSKKLGGLYEWTQANVVTVAASVRKLTLVDLLPGG